MNTTTSLPTLPQTELDTLIREGDALLNREIRVVWQKEDEERAGSYIDTHGGCLLCCALKRMGYADVSVGGVYAKINGELWDFESQRTCAANPIHFYFSGQSLVGKTLVLTKRE